MGSRGRSISFSANRAVSRRKNMNLMRAKAAKKAALIKELEKNKVPFTKKDIVFITRDYKGKITWLEKGKPKAGLMHINNHAKQFKDAWGVSKNNIPSFINKVIENGKCILSVPDKGGTRRHYRYKGRELVVVVTGSTGFIVTAFPRRMK